MFERREKILIVGQAPPSSHPDGPPLSGESGERLALLCGLRTPEQLRMVFDCVNLIEKYPGRSEHGEDGFDPAIAQLGVHRLIQQGVLRPGRDVIALGSKVWRRLTHDRNYAPNFLPRRARPSGHGVGFGEYRLYLSPHPSGLSRWWNQEANLRAAATFWHNAARGIMPEAPPKSPRIAHRAS